MEEISLLVAIAMQQQRLMSSLSFLFLVMAIYTIGIQSETIETERTLVQQEFCTLSSRRTFVELLPTMGQAILVIFIFVVLLHDRQQILDYLHKMDDSSTAQ
jgi:hypothetical protein